jgi:membrane protease YdiL (CAAX protease family)
MVESRRYQMPPIVWAVLLGLSVTLAGSLPWSMLVVLNLKYGARFPWASVVAIVYLVSYFKYLNGSGPPRSTAVKRAKLLRAHGLPPIAWRWALAAGGSANAALAALFIVVGRIGWIPGSGRQFPAAPVWSMAAWLFTGAAVAGIAEECGFRGYMQKMLEERQGAIVAIAVSIVVFGAMHLSHGLSVAILFDAAWGVVYGALAYFTGSILPSIVLHASLDGLEFFLAFRFAGASAPRLVRFDGPAWFALAMAAVLSVLALWSFQKLRNLRLGG